MKIKYLITLIILALMLPVSVRGQGMSVADKDLTWYSEKGTEKHSDKTILENFRIEAKGGTGIAIKRGTEQTINFSIITIEGNWSDLKTDGQLIYGLRYQKDVYGKITIKREGKDITIEVDFRQGNPYGMYHEFISSVK
jgi:hypothetical protein